MAWGTMLRIMSTINCETLLSSLGLSSGVNPGVFNGKWLGSGPIQVSLNPTTNLPIASVITATRAELAETITAVNNAKSIWRALPSPKRGEIVRQMRVALAEKIVPLGQLVSLEMGKISAEGVGEVQEYIDVCDYAVGLSRMLNGSVIPSERPGHFMMEQYNPLGVVGVISAVFFANLV